MIESILLGLFTLAAAIFIYNSHYRWTYLFASALFVFFAGLMLAATGQWQRALNFASILFVVLMLFHRLKIHYYKQPFLISDLVLVTDWRNWGTLLHYKGALVAIAGLIGLLAYAVLGWNQADRLVTSWRLVALAASAVSFGLMWHYSRHPDAIRVWLDSLPDDGRDVFLNLPMSCRGLFFSAPKFEGDAAAFQAQMATVEPHSIRTEEKPTIVVWLQESTFDPRHFALKTHAYAPIEMYQPKPDTAFTSPLRVHTLGGATWKSEFAFLAGLPSSDFGAMASAVFYSVVPHLQFSLIKNLKAQGYYCVALSPFTKGNYNAKTAYDHFGFDLMLQPQDLGYPAPISKNLWHIGSDEMALYAEKILQKTGIPALEKVEKPIFLYVLTMREHGPYRTDHPDQFNLAENGFSANLTSGLNDYIQRIQALDRVMEGVNDSLKAKGKPYLLGYFGDHQVGICGEMVENTLPYPQPHYITHFSVRSNLTALPPQQERFLDLAQAGGVLLELAGLPTDEFMQANIAMRKLSGGKLEDCEDEALLANYRSYLYNTLNAAK